MPQGVHDVDLRHARVQKILRRATSHVVDDQTNVVALTPHPRHFFVPASIAAKH